MAKGGARRFTARILTISLLLIAMPAGLSTFQIASADSSYSLTKIAMAGDGGIIYVTNSAGSIWKSSNNGAAWSALSAAGIRSWNSIATSQDGSSIVASVSSGGIYVSRDSGATWSERTGAGSRSWRTVTMSSDGSKIRAITTNTLKLYQSDDYGVTWIENATLPTVLNAGFNPDGTRSSNGCYTNPCNVPNWAELTASGSATKIALLAAAAGPYESGRQVFISQDNGATWTQTMGCCRDQSAPRQMASSKSDTNWTIMMGNYQSAPGYLRFDAVNQVWTRTGLRVRERSGDATTVQTTTWKGFAIAADGLQTIFTGSWQGWESGHAGRNESLFTGAIDSELSGVFHDDSTGSYYDDVAISDSGVVRAAIKSSTGQFIVSTDSGATFTKVKIFNLPLTPSINSQIEYSESYTVQVSNYDPDYSWSVTTTSGTASINSTGLVTVLNPVGRSTLTVRTNKSGVPEGVATFTARALDGHIKSTAIWESAPTAVGSNVFSSSIYEVATHPITGDIYVGGSFVNVGGNAAADYIARFDGTSWSGLTGPSGGLSSGSGGGSSGVFSIKFDASGNLYAGGNFINAGGVSEADYFAKWDGSNWSAVGASNLNGSLRDIEVFEDGRILIAGQFTNAGSVTGANYIAMWSASGWQKFGATSLTGIALAIARSRNGGIYIGGHFTNAGAGSNANKVAMYQNGDWVALGNSFGNAAYPVRALAVDDRASTDVLYAGGSFYLSGKSQSLYSWSSNSWQVIDYTFTSSIRNLLFHQRYGLLISGWFESDNRYASGIALYEAGVLYGIGDSANNGSGAAAAVNYVDAVTVTSGGQIYIGGAFSSVASVSNTRYLARTSAWTPPVLLSERVNVQSPTASEIERARLERERLEKVRLARLVAAQMLGRGEKLTPAVIAEAEYPNLKSISLEHANQIFLAQPLDARTVDSNIVKVLEKVAILQDLTEPLPMVVSPRKLVEYEILHADSIYPALTLMKLKKLPHSQRENFTKIEQAITLIQEQFVIRRIRLDDLKDRYQR